MVYKRANCCAHRVVRFLPGPESDHTDGQELFKGIYLLFHLIFSIIIAHLPSPEVCQIDDGRQQDERHQQRIRVGPIDGQLVRRVVGHCQSRRNGIGQNEIAQHEIG